MAPIIYLQLLEKNPVKTAPFAWTQHWNGKNSYTIWNKTEVTMQKHSLLWPLEQQNKKGVWC